MLGTYHHHTDENKHAGQAGAKGKQQRQRQPKAIGRYRQQQHDNRVPARHDAAIDPQHQQAPPAYRANVRKPMGVAVLVVIMVGMAMVMVSVFMIMIVVMVVMSMSRQMKVIGLARESPQQQPKSEADNQHAAA